MTPRVLIIGPLPSLAQDIQRNFKAVDVEFVFRDVGNNAWGGGTFDSIILWAAFMQHGTSEHIVRKYPDIKPIYVNTRGTSSVIAAIRGCLDRYHQSPTPVARH